MPPPATERSQSRAAGGTTIAAVLPRSVGFLVLPQFSTLALGGMADTLTQCNEVLGKRIFDCVMLTADGQAVVSNNGMIMQPHGALSQFKQLDAIVVVSDTPLPQRGFEPAVDWLQAFAVPAPHPSTIGLNARAQAPQRKWLGGIGTGAYLLARAQTLNGYRATLHWPYATVLAEHYSQVVVSTNLYEIDRNRMTCAGATASLDMTLAWLRSEHGDDLANELLAHFGLERHRGRNESQRVPITARIGGGQPKLTEAVSLMEANFAEPLPMEDIARLVGVSRRQLERLFKQHLKTLPSKYYLELRLTRARHLLQQTSQSILQIGLSCGFSSGPHFSSAYRTHFGVTPREQRSQRLNPAMVVANGDTDTEEELLDDLTVSESDDA